MVWPGAGLSGWLDTAHTRNCTGEIDSCKGGGGVWCPGRTERHVVVAILELGLLGRDQRLLILPVILGWPLLRVPRLLLLLHLGLDLLLLLLLGSHRLLLLGLAFPSVSHSRITALKQSTRVPAPLTKGTSATSPIAL